eukprot:gb/GEZN01013424.1/.p1 GENE.gb/GEZN01013424.1/~~gb/GEZN01013424.1/.p1  ORF type:complete len:271 (-),score=39.19 gb/GEZN01013424.1/:107-919(-)
MEIPEVVFSDLKLVTCERRGGVGVIILNRPQALNALSKAMMEDVATAFARWNQPEESCGCIVLTGSGRAFAAGADISEFKELTPHVLLLRDPILRWEAISSSQIPVIAAVNGLALGGGCEIAMMCDIIVASERAQFAQPEVKLGVIPGAGGTQRLARTVGKSLAMELCLTGRSMSAQEALQRGLVSHVFPHADLMPEALRLAAQVAAIPKPVLLLCKQAVNAAYETTLQNGIALERAAYHTAYALPERTEGMQAFVEKRKPNWSNLRSSL